MSGLIDQKQLKKLLQSIDKRYSYFQIDDTLQYQDKYIQRIIDSLQIKPLTKADFDNNGYTDLLVIGDGDYGIDIIVIMDTGNNKMYIKRLSIKAFGNLSLPIIEKHGDETLINFIGERMSKWPMIDSPKILESKMLLFKYGNFIEYNNTVPNYDIKRIDNIAPSINHNNIWILFEIINHITKYIIFIIII